MQKQNNSLQQKPTNNTITSAKLGETLEAFAKTSKTKRETSKMLRQSMSEERGEGLLSASLATKANPSASLLKKRLFTKTECSSTSIKLQWEHLSKES